MYVTISPFSTDKAVLGCVYVAFVAVPAFNFETSTCGSLLVSVAFPFIFVMNFLKAKSNISLFGSITNFSKSSSSSKPL